MSNFLQMNLDAPKLRVMAEDEYQLRVRKLEMVEKKKKPGEYQLVVNLSVEGHPEAFDVQEYLGLPAGDDDEATKVKKVNRIYNFLDAFSIPYTPEGFDQNAAVGATGWARLSIESDEQYGDRNRAKFLAPR